MAHSTAASTADQHPQSPKPGETVGASSDGTARGKAAGGGRGSSQWPTIKQLLHVAWQSRWTATAAIVSSVFVTVFEVLVPLYTKDGIDIATGAASTSAASALLPQVSPLNAVIIVLVSVALLRFVVQFTRRYTAGQIALDTQHRLRVAMLDTLLRLDDSARSRVDTGQVLSRAISDLNMVMGFLSMLPLFIGIVLKLALTIAIMLWLNVPLALLSIALLPAILVGNRFVKTKLFAATWSAQNQAGVVAGLIEQAISGIRVVMAFSGQERESRAVARASRTLYSEKLREARLAAKFSSLFDHIPQLGFVLIILAGGYATIHGYISIGTFVAFSTYVSMLTGLARQVSGFFIRMNMALSSVKRIFDVLELEPDVKDPANPLPLPAGSLGLSVEEIVFSYPTAARVGAVGASTAAAGSAGGSAARSAGAAGGSSVAGADADSSTGAQTVLAGVTARFPAGRRSVIIGPPGAGKTVLFNILAGFSQPDSGEVYFTAGDERVPLSRLTHADLRSRVGVVFDKPILLSATIRDNVTFGAETSDDAVRRALDIAAASDFIDALPDGWDTMVGERGVTLSGGQRQRIALAREILRGPDVLLLDDATSAIDAATEQRIYTALQRELPETTIVAIAHRSSTVDIADFVFVMDEGRVTAHGPREEMAENPQVRHILALNEEQLPSRAAIRHQQLLLEQLAKEPGPDQSSGTAARPAAEVAAGEDAQLHDPELLAKLWPRLPVAAGAARQRYLSAPATGTPDGEIASPQAGVATAPGGSQPSAMPKVRGGHPGGRPGGRAGFAANVMVTPELLAQVAALPPATAQPGVDPLADDAAYKPFRVKELLGHARGLILFAVVLLALSVAVEMVFPALMRLAIDKGVSGGNPGILWTIAGLSTVAVVASAAISWGLRLVTATTGERLLYILRVRCWDHVMGLSLRFFDSNRHGAIMTRMTTDIDALSSFLQEGLAQTVVAAVTLLAVGIMVTTTDPVLAAYAGAVIPVIVIATFFFQRYSAARYSEAREVVSGVNANFQENLHAYRAIQLHGSHDRVLNSFQEESSQYRRIRMRAQTAVALYFPGISSLSELAQAIVFGVGAHAIAQGDLSAGVLVAFVMYLGQLFLPIQQLSQLFDSYQQAAVGLRRIRTLMDETPDVADHGTNPDARHYAAEELRLDNVSFRYAPVPTKDNQGAATNAQGATKVERVAAKSVQGATKVERGEDVTVLDDALFAHAPARAAAQDLNVAISPGTTVALVGPTGAGKTTMVKLLARFYDPDSGRLTAGGENIADFPLKDWRTTIGMVPQESQLFEGTVASNIAYGKPNASRQEILAAVARVGALAALAALPQGLDQPIAAGGQGLSSGQRQLVALARAELLEPEILLLDEATATLDPATELAMLQASQRVTQSRTSVIVAHRLATAARADRILVIDHGQIIQDGNHEELLAVPGMYRDLWHAAQAAE